MTLRIMMIIVLTLTAGLAGFYQGANVGHDIGLKEGRADCLFKGCHLDLRHNGELVN